MPALLTIEEAMKVFAGRNPFYWNFLNEYYSNADWNDATSDYNALEEGLDNGDRYGVVPCPTRPRPNPR